jgi:hypothetical protein
MTLAAIAAAAAVLASSAHAAASTPDAATAEALFLQARRAMEAGSYREACQEFAESQRLDPGAGTLMNLAACEEKLGKLASAWEHWKESLDTLPPTDDRVSFARSRVDALEKTLPHLTVALSPADPVVRVFRDDIELRPASRGVSLPVDPGSHVVTVSAPGHRTERFTVSVDPGQERRLDVHAGPLEPGAGPSRDPLRVGLGWGLGGLGVAGVVAAAVTGALIVHDKATVDANCPNKACTNQAGLDAVSSGKTLVVANAAAFGVGAVGLGLGAYFLLTSQRATPSRPVVGVSAGPGTVGVACGGAF